MKLIGDPHIGREFRAHVPLDRVGDREEMMMKQFETELNASDETTVIVGDLFDRPVVAIQTLYRTLDVILNAAARKPDRKIIIIAGNHDLNKAIEVRGSFHVLKVALELVPNVIVLTEPTVIGFVAYFPWQYEKTALQQVEELDIGEANVAIGHWDLESFGEHDDHLCPTEALINKGITDIYSGHWHVAGQYKVGNYWVDCTGSMQPMTHAEDPKEKMYVTVTHEQYQKLDLSLYKDHYIRVRCTKGTDVVPPETCLGFKVEYHDGEAREVERVNLGTFDMSDILKQAFETYEVHKETAQFIREKLNGLA